MSSKRSDSTATLLELEATSKLTLSKKESFHVFMTFFFLGTSGLVMWNSFLNMLPSVLDVLYPSLGVFTDTVVPLYFTILCGVAFLTVFRPFSSVLCAYVGLTGVIFCCGFYLIVCVFSPVSWIPYFFHFIGALMALNAILILNCGFYTAAAVPHQCMGSISSGMGFAGLFTLSIWIFISYTIFTEKTPYNIRSCMTVLTSLSATFVLLTMWYWTWFLRSRWVNCLFNEESSTKSKWYTRNFANLVSKEYAGRPEPFDKIGYMGIAKITWKTLALRFFVFFETMLLFPNIIPVSLAVGLGMRDLLIVVYQVCDFLGRYLTHLEPQLQVSSRVALTVLCFRAGLVVFFLCMALYQHQIALFRSPVLQVASFSVMAFSNGWLGTCAAIQLPQLEGSVKMKIVRSSMGLAASYWGIFSAQWASKLFRVYCL